MKVGHMKRSLNMTETSPYTMTKPHIKLMNMLESLELGCVEEVLFHPYTVDIYIPELHIAFEADGPQHNVKRDIKRDLYLMGTYALPVLRITEHELNNKERTWIAIARAFAHGTYEITANDRIALAEQNGWKF